ncbi:Mobile element protein [Lachnospiraceae bacterium TWA4]|nr:Mobile element protein [Lachnospiraceae bacterium TWA4]
MKNGNQKQKHLTFEQRVEIEKGLTENRSFAQIARIIGKDPSTISKEVRRHIRIKERQKDEFSQIPCIHRMECKKRMLCDEMCGIQCKKCRKPTMKCIQVCPSYEILACKKLDKPPYVCNGCGKKGNCRLPRKFYSSKYAHDEYRSVLKDCRVGINQTPESIQAMNNLLVPLIKDKNQSINHIYATHAEELGCSRRTLYSYIDACVFDVRNGDLRRIVRYKKRKKSTQTSAKDRSYRIGHNYEDFQKYLQVYPDTNVVEMDCVESKRGEKETILTLTFRNCHLMLMFLLENQDQENVLNVFLWLETILGKTAFKRLFPVILTDGGSEFSARKEMEEFSDGSKSTTIFYCDPYSFWQKGACEKNHEYIRYIRPKGSSFADLNDDKIHCMMNHINSEKRDSLNGHSPYELSLLLLDNTLHKALGLTAIAPDDVMISPELLK